MNRRKFLKLLGGLLPLPLVYPLLKRDPGQLTVDALKAAGDSDLIYYHDTITIDQRLHPDVDAPHRKSNADHDEYLLRVLDADND